MCGIIGIFSQGPSVSSSIYNGLLMLQHRGQDSAGIATVDKGRIFNHRKKGLVSHIFDSQILDRLYGSVGIGHCRYATSGSSSSEEEMQPLYTNSPYGIALAHNGNLLDTKRLRLEVMNSSGRHINTSSDSEILLNILGHSLEMQRRSHACISLEPSMVFRAVEHLQKTIRGSYAVVAIFSDGSILVFRDPHGIRPLVFGKTQSADGKDEYVFSSESIALDILNVPLERDLLPGECIFIDSLGVMHQEVLYAQEHTPCVFEYIYLSRPDSVLEGVSVYAARLTMGRFLARKIEKKYPDLHIDIVAPVPDSGRPPAIELAMHLEIPYREGFVKSWYVGRTFIMPDQKGRVSSVRQKLNIIQKEVVGRNILLVDDSIVRGTTCREIINMARKAGARSVYVASAAPPVKYPNFYGINMPTYKELVAASLSEEEVAHHLGADALIYQSLEDLEAAIREHNPHLSRFESSCFDGRYIL